MPSKLTCVPIASDLAIQQIRVNEPENRYTTFLNYRADFLNRIVCDYVSKYNASFFISKKIFTRNGFQEEGEKKTKTKTKQTPHSMAAIEVITLNFLV